MCGIGQVWLSKSKQKAFQQRLESLHNDELETIPLVSTKYVDVPVGRVLRLNRDDVKDFSSVAEILGMRPRKSKEGPCMEISCARGSIFGTWRWTKQRLRC